MTAYYNEIDPYAAQWLRNLVAKGHLPKGDVDERSIVDVRPDDLRPYHGGQCHFFAGIGGWPYALQLAGWPDDKPVWTGSCPCQPLSVAGQRKGHADERHLWPAFYRLIAECRPATVFGEQVASKDGREWLAAVRVDLEAIGYACGCADLPAAGVGAPHIRQRLWWVAKSDEQRREGENVHLLTGRSQQAVSGIDGSSAAGKLADAEGAELSQRERNAGTGRETDGAYQGQGSGENSPWSDLIWLPCTDGKARPTQPGIFPLVDGPAFHLGAGGPFEGKSRVGMLRAAGNAIVPQIAAAFISAAMEAFYATAT